MRLSFLIKVPIVAALIILVDRLFPSSFAGARIGCLAITWLIAVAVARRDVRKSPLARIGLGAAALFAVALFNDPGPFAWVLFWCSLSATALLPKVVRFDDAWHWAARLALHAATGVTKPLADVRSRPFGCRRSGRSSFGRSSPSAPGRAYDRMRPSSGWRHACPIRNRLFPARRCPRC